MALILLAANNAQTVLSAGISSSATTLTVNTGTGALFPAPVSGTSFYKLTLVDAATGQLTEIMHVTARTGDVMTVLRAQEGTTARAWSANDIVANMLTSGTLAFFAQLESPTFTGAPKAPTAPNGTSTTQLATTAFVASAITAATGRLLNIQVFTASGTYTPTSGTKKIRVKAQGAGGGGGGAAASTTSGTLAAGHGGSAGTYGETGIIDATSISTVSVTVGIGGTSSAGANGIAGGQSSFGSYIVAPGGAAGALGASSTSTFSLVPDLSPTSDCSGTNVLINIPGEGGLGQISFATGTAGGTTSTGTSKGGHGGSSFMGKGGGAFVNNTTPSAGSGYGGGGAGGNTSFLNGTTAVAGSSGSSGIVIVEEYA
ncbi:hypothetical protein [Enterobacter kobei]|uniref:glycine-rich domain-containing protein n=1 Tax=Enterobacter kobei TaxID=208224 RepID=UPI0023AFD299|nr:hypothetical protein [Enterobacter kobei]MDE7915318.1 hypothetical protein [Enterobacter kobei]